MMRVNADSKALFLPDFIGNRTLPSQFAKGEKMIDIAIGIVLGVVFFTVFKSITKKWNIELSCMQVIFWWATYTLVVFGIIKLAEPLYPQAGYVVSTGIIVLALLTGFTMRTSGKEKNPKVVEK